ncbi:hypothetical protein GCM10011392_24440 [Wenxinia marina]|nr:hypothetical protein GCM10011392_24440 [Wenxinia marina]
MRSALAIFLGLMPLPAVSQDFNGLCFPGDGCTGDVPISGNTFYTCEENCLMENATPVRGMDAILYDVTCRGDSGTSLRRMMFVRTFSSSGTSAWVIENGGITPLIRCR